MDQWHGASFWLFPCLSLAVDTEVASYDAPSFGVGAYFQGFWFTGRWVASLLSESIAYQELFPVVDTQWSRKHVLFRSDNEAMVHMLNSRTSRTPSIMPRLRSLLLSAARYSFSFSSRLSQVSVTSLLILFPVFIGRDFSSWLQRNSLCQRKFPPSCCWT